MVILRIYFINVIFLDSYVLIPNVCVEILLNLALFIPGSSYLRKKIQFGDNAVIKIKHNNASSIIAEKATAHKKM